MDGILNILKPSGMTSHDVVSYIRKMTGIKKVGHTGTLDPAAAGVLPICLGRATKASEYITDGTKQYRAELQLGIITDTGDSQGKVIETREWRNYVNLTHSNQNIELVFKAFIGSGTQLPPMYSAVKVNGKKLYELARKGQEVERKPRKIEIYNINVVEIMPAEGTILFDITCSKGTYIRTLCEDIGNKLGCGAHMSYLVRTKVSEFNLKDTITLEEVQDLTQKNTLNNNVLPIVTVFNEIPKYVITDNNEQNAFLNGGQIILKDEKLEKYSIIGIYLQDKFIGLGKVLKKNNNFYIKVDKFF